jgi:hypothetical protein
MRDAYRILVGISDGITPRERRSGRCEDNIKTNLNKLEVESFARKFGSIGGLFSKQ